MTEKRSLKARRAHGSVESATGERFVGRVHMLNRFLTWKYKMLRKTTSEYRYYLFIVSFLFITLVFTNRFCSNFVNIIKITKAIII